MGQEKNIKILHAEDDPLFAKICMAEFKDAGFDATHAVDGVHALEILAQDEKPHIIILDLIMPRKTGFDVLQEIRGNQEFNDIPIIIFSNLSQVSDKEYCEQLGIHKYFFKGETTVRNLVEYISSLF